MSVPALCSVCQSVATASLTPNQPDWEHEEVYESWQDYFLMDEHNFAFDETWVSQIRCEGSGMTPQAIKR